MKMRLVRVAIIILVLTSNIGCDQISKHVIRQHMQSNEQINMLGNHFMLTRIENTGAFLSAGESLPQPIKVLLLTMLPLVALAVAIAYLFLNKNLGRNAMIGICFAAGGGIGNLYDRIVHGSVTDFLHIDFGLFRTGIFNMADVSIMLGVILLMMDMYLRERNSAHQKAISDNGEINS